jgi:hypothetical protein
MIWLDKWSGAATKDPDECRDFFWSCSITDITWVSEAQNSRSIRDGITTFE